MSIVCTEGERIASTDPRRIRKLQALLNLVCFVVVFFIIIFVKYCIHHLSLGPQTGLRLWRYGGFGGGLH